METRALGRRPARRALYAAALLAVLLAGLLVAWFFAGWRDVRARQHEVQARAGGEAAARALELSRDLHGELEALLARESSRPYFHYQNLFHDPKASTAWSIAPSPLAAGAEDGLVLGYFQLDGRGRVTTPTINDAVPELSESGHLAANRAFLDEVTRSLASALAPSPGGAVVAQVEPSPPPPRPSPPQQAQSQQVIQVDPGTYSQNSIGNSAYYRPQPPQPRPQPQAKPDAITITVSTLEWRTLPFAGAPALIAVRDVQTPDGTLVQGFVVDRATLTAKLATKAGTMVAELHALDRGASESTELEIAPGWQVHVAANPRVVIAAAREAAQLARGFVIRFVALGAIAVLAAGLVVLLVARAERLARERSQFAAAAAHELRTPLAGLQLYGDMLADGLGDPSKLRDYAKRMSEEASRLGRVVSNVLGFSQLERGNLSVDAQVGSLGEALVALADSARPALDRAGAVLELDVAPELRARFDRDALARIVGNLLDNAEKYGRGASDRTIRLAARDLGEVVEIVVTDHGPGVADKTPLFQPFARGVNTDGPAGLGLGLALSRLLARAMGGELVHRKADGRGAAFALRLPRA